MRYETPQDIANEANTAAQIAKQTNSTHHKVPLHYEVYCDFAFERDGEICAFCEIKHRHIPGEWGSYPDIILSAHKWLKGKELFRSTGIPWLFAVAIENNDASEIWCYRVDADTIDDNFKISWGGRTKNRRRNADVEPVVHIPADLFKRCSRFVRVQPEVNQ